MADRPLFTIDAKLEILGAVGCITSPQKELDSWAQEHP